MSTNDLEIDIHENLLRLSLFARVRALEISNSSQNFKIRNWQNVFIAIDDDVVEKIVEEKIH